MDLRRKNDVMLMFQPLGYHGAATSKDQPSFGARRLQQKNMRAHCDPFFFLPRHLFCFFWYLKCLVMFFSKITVPFWPKRSKMILYSLPFNLHGMLAMPYPGSQWLQVILRLRLSQLRLMKVLKAQHQRRMGTLHGWNIVYGFVWK